MTSKYNDPNGPSERPTNFGSAKGSSSEGPEVRPEVRPEIRPKMGPKAGSKIDPQAGPKAGPQLPRTISQRPAQQSNQRSQPPQQRSLIYDVPLTGRSSNRAPSYAPPQAPSTASATPRTAPLADTDSDFPVQLPLYKRIPASLLGMRWLRSWPLVMLILFGIVGSAGTMAVVSLFRIPNLPNCRAIFWPTASASLRLQCAESYAAQGDVQNLLAAIALVDELPEDHPLRSDIINDRIEDWATLVLDLAERSFEEGDLENAIESARKIPARTAAAAVVEDRIQRWQTIWKAGEEGFNTAVDKVKEKDFQSAFTLSVVLLDVDNKYWSTEKYNELTKLISLAREDSRRLSEALGLADEGTLKGFREALKKLREIGEESVFFAEAQGERKNIAREMLEASEALLADRQLSEAQSMLNAIPRDTGLDAEVADFQIFVTAYQQAWAGNANGLENAINRMKTIRRDRPAYAKAQRLIAQWEGELQDVAVLNQARERASRGSTADLTAAISMAGRISQNSAQWPEAADQIGEWQVRVETAQDRPILDRADQLARPGTPDSLRAAIQEARKISSRRTLGPEADRRIATWTGRIQRIEDQPLLDQARQRATTGDRAGAIAIASRIGEGRALYDTAQADIGRWQTQENGRARLGEAITTAQRGDANSLSAAIGIANQVPAGSDSRARADSQINRWSWDLLRQAESASGRNIETAIALASQIPSQAEAYEPAQVRIRNWQATLREIEASRRPASGATPAEPVELDENGLPIDLDLAPAEE